MREVLRQLRPERLTTRSGSCSGRGDKNPRRGDQVRSRTYRRRAALSPGNLLPSRQRAAARAPARSLIFFGWLSTRIVSSSRTRNHTGTLSGWPSGRTVVSHAIRLLCRRASTCSRRSAGRCPVRFTEVLTSGPAAVVPQVPSRPSCGHRRNPADGSHRVTSQLRAQGAAHIVCVRKRTRDAESMAFGQAPGCRVLGTGDSGNPAFATARHPGQGRAEDPALPHRARRRPADPWQPPAPPQHPGGPTSLSSDIQWYVPHFLVRFCRI
jgi:hypothetical protein